LTDHAGQVVLRLDQFPEENTIIETGTLSRGVYLIKISMLNNYLPENPPVLFKIVLM
jgi:hypothetical protein